MSVLVASDVIRLKILRLFIVLCSPRTGAAGAIKWESIWNQVFYKI